MNKKEIFIDKPCLLCDGTDEVQIYACGPVTFLCKKCRAILVKYWDYKKRFDEFHKKRQFEVNSQRFFRATFDNDPVKFIWGD